jgi:hypothetical protein
MDELIALANALLAGHARTDRAVEVRVYSEEQVAAEFARVKAEHAEEGDPAPSALFRARNHRAALELATAVANAVRGSCTPEALSFEVRRYHGRMLDNLHLRLKGA